MPVCNSDNHATSNRQMDLSIMLVEICRQHMELNKVNEAALP